MKIRLQYKGMRIDFTNEINYTIIRLLAFDQYPWFHLGIEGKYLDLKVQNETFVEANCKSGKIYVFTKEYFKEENIYCGFTFGNTSKIKKLYIVYSLSEDFKTSVSQTRDNNESSN